MHMRDKDRIFIGACAGVPMGLIGVVCGSLLGAIYNRIVKHM